MFFTFICYLTIGIPLAILPGFVHGQLGYDAMLAGLAISTQYVATVLSRPQAGRMTDLLGPKRTVLYGLAACAGSGVATVVCANLTATPSWAFGVLVAGRLSLGIGESMVATGAIMWGIGRVGAAQTARVISWNGVSSYSAIALGAPLGVVLTQYGGLMATGILVAVISLLSIILAWRLSPVATVTGKRLPFTRVLRHVTPYGVGLALGGTGFGVIATFITLFFAHEHWAGAAGTLTLFGLCFIGVRLLLPNAINRFGGFRVAIASFLVESVGLAILFLSSGEPMAYAGAALAGAGFSLVFPALAVEAVRAVPSQNRGTALGAYSVFIDFSLGITGPLAGAIVNGYGYRGMFLASCGGVLCALLLSLWLSARRQPAA
ncbi:MAG: MFS transporter [Paludibacterium sp.]|nr:MFS transporter [Paludibacterium sp.]MBV8647709.1 MFS transporter [Paludibacterium sp.]